ncbi:hypothetical protein HanRHA438_Chr13g0586741 [Helianthus annuus]|uniref:Uncharacterized protein n=1 Tax=Helianthus annuus TaxID=4232 RepID=A0A251U1E2_HELAN|nr:hypothetical protein HanXRQr2_Chr13g0575961 [Helianthus annuus]KAJ0475986.1 hypothetical protein HanHA300_Chr13g0471961 [Helianthus annuus]KAJ0480031.1 hypothetical protein HanIR_Chr13g0626851 [Helianthus annuus]KAJ0496791.1 hypothetical protein HanHA89_Chr13g0503861 [Helianthus annuus]KAJ0662824.1 hypothetical protein HanLR1_Chr13g0474051 [Helianthus annuus]
MSNTYFTSSSVMGFDFRLLYCAIRFLAIWLLQSRWNAFDVCLICLSPIEVYSSLDRMNDSCSPSVDTIPPLLFRRRYIVMVFVSFNIWF